MCQPHSLKYGSGTRCFANKLIVRVLWNWGVPNAFCTPVIRCCLMRISYRLLPSGVAPNVAPKRCRLWFVVRRKYLIGSSLDVLPAVPRRQAKCVTCWELFDYTARDSLHSFISLRFLSMIFPSVVSSWSLPKGWKIIVIFASYFVVLCLGMNQRGGQIR